MKKIYLVTSGSYSDYKVEAVFDDKALAQKFIDSFKKGGWNEMGIEEFELNPHNQKLKKDYIPYFLRMDKVGKAYGIDVADSSYGFENEDPGFDIKGDMFLHVFAKDETHAIKIANEKRAQLIAMNKWPEKKQ